MRCGDCEFFKWDKGRHFCTVGDCEVEASVHSCKHFKIRSSKKRCYTCKFFDETEFDFGDELDENEYRACMLDNLFNCYSYGVYPNHLCSKWVKRDGKIDDFELKIFRCGVAI